MQRYYIFFIWQNVFHSFLFSLSFSSFILSFLSSFLLPSSFIFQYIIMDCACMCVPAHICECTYVYYKEQYDIKRCEVFNTVKFEIKNETFFLKNLVVSEIVSTFALAFEKYTFSKQQKKEFFERFYINRQVVQEAVLDYTLLYIGSMKRLGKRNEPSRNWQVRFTKLQ